MENRSHALIAGLFTLTLGFAALLVLYVFGEKREETREVMVVTQQNVSGLNPQAQVRYRGIRVGKVLDIRLDPADVRNILILLEVDRLVPLTRGTTAKLSYQGVTGIAHVLLEDSGQDVRALEDDLPRIAMQPSLLDHLEDALPAVLAQTRQFLEGANEVLNPKNRHSLERSLANLEQATGRMSTSLGQLEKLLSEDNVTGLSKAAQESGPLLGEARKLMTQMRGLSAKADAILGEPSVSGNGDMVNQINGMTSELSATARQLNRVLHMLEDSPQSLVFGSPPGPPGPGEPGFSPPSAPATH